jgi:acyl carrier protein
MDELIQLLEDSCHMVDFKTEKHLWSGKLIDSMDLVNIMTAIEEKYGICIEIDMITAENFDSAESIYNLINKLRESK